MVGGKDLQFVEINSIKELEYELGAIVKILHGKESDDNWEKRERAIAHVRAMINTRSPLDQWKETLARGIHDMADGIVKTVHSLRTTLAMECLHLLSDIASQLGSLLDVYTADLFLSSLLQCSSVTKKIVAVQSMETTKIFVTYTPFRAKTVQSLTDTMNEKNNQSRHFAAIYLQTFLQVHSSRDATRQTMEKAGCLDLVEKSLKKGLMDATPFVREASRQIYRILQEQWPARAEKFFRQCDLSTQKQLAKSKSAQATESRRILNSGLSSQPSSQSSSQPSSLPSSRSSSQPSSRPSSQPSSRPSSQPLSRPSSQHSLRTSSQPSSQPSSLPSSQPIRPTPRRTTTETSRSSLKQLRKQHSQSAHSIRMRKASISSASTVSTSSSGSGSGSGSVATSILSTTSTVQRTANLPRPPLNLTRTESDHGTVKKNTDSLAESPRRRTASGPSADHKALAARISLLHALSRRDTNRHKSAIKEIATELQRYRSLGHREGTPENIPQISELSQPLMDLLSKDETCGALLDWTGLAGVLYPLIQPELYIPTLLLYAHKPIYADGVKRLKVYMGRHNTQLVSQLLELISVTVKDPNLLLDTHCKQILQNDPRQCSVLLQRLLEWLDHITCEYVGLGDDDDLLLMDQEAHWVTNNTGSTDEPAFMWFDDDDHMRICLREILPLFDTPRTDVPAYSTWVSLIGRLRLANQRVFEAIAQQYQHTIAIHLFSNTATPFYDNELDHSLGSIRLDDDVNEISEREIKQEEEGSGMTQDLSQMLLEHADEAANTAHAHPSSTIADAKQNAEPMVLDAVAVPVKEEQEQTLTHIEPIPAQCMFDALADEGPLTQRVLEMQEDNETQTPNDQKLSQQELSACAQVTLIKQETLDHYHEQQVDANLTMAVNHDSLQPERLKLGYPEENETGMAQELVALDLESKVQSPKDPHSCLCTVPPASSPQSLVSTDPEPSIWLETALTVSDLGVAPVTACITSPKQKKKLARTSSMDDDDMMDSKRRKQNQPETPLQLYTRRICDRDVDSSVFSALKQLTQEEMDVAMWRQTMLVLGEFIVSSASEEMRVEGILLIGYLVHHVPEALQDNVDEVVSILAKKLLDSGRIAYSKIVTAAEETIETLFHTLPNEIGLEVLGTLINYYQSDDANPAQGQGIHPATTLLHQLGKTVHNVPCQLLNEILEKGLADTLIKCYNHSLTIVRKSCVQVLVRIHNVLGEDLIKRHLSKSIRVDQMSLLKHYIERSEARDV